MHILLRAPRRFGVRGIDMGWVPIPVPAVVGQGKGKGRAGNKKKLLMKTPSIRDNVKEPLIFCTAVISAPSLARSSRSLAGFPPEIRRVAFNLEP